MEGFKEARVANQPVVKVLAHMLFCLPTYYFACTRTILLVACTHTILLARILFCLHTHYFACKHIILLARTLFCLQTYYFACTRTVLLAHALFRCLLVACTHTILLAHKQFGLHTYKASNSGNGREAPPGAASGGGVRGETYSLKPPF
jgi:hypothetical protein